MAGPDLVEMGRASGAFGLGGELRVYSFAEDDEVFARARAIWVGNDSQAPRRLTPVSIRSHGGRLLIKTAELASREEADALKGAWIFLDRRDLPPLEEGEYYWFQLKGARVSLASGRELGRIEAISDYGAHEVWSVRSPQGREALIPALDQVVLSMDLAAGEVVVALPPGLLESQGWPAEFEEE